MRRSRIWRGYGVALAVAMAGTPLAAQDTGPDPRIDAIFAGRTAQGPGCAVGVARDDRVLALRGYGLADLEHAAPITPKTVFAVASIAKQVTAFAVGLLAQEGRLSLDDDVRTYIPELKDYGRPITLAQLVHHTNGLRDQGQLASLAGWRAGDVATQGDMLALILAQQALNFAPGAEVVYGNSGYTMLAEVVRRVSGQALPAFAQARIFTPIGMSDTRFGERHDTVIRDRAIGYSPAASGGWLRNVPPIEYYGPSGLFSTVGDLLKWQQNLVDGRVGGRALAEWMATSGTLSDGTAIGYGGGLRLGRYRGLRTIGHDGVDGGYRAETVAFPERRLAVVTLCNASVFAPGDLARAVAETVLDLTAQPPALSPAIAAPPLADLAAWPGTYWSVQTDELVQIEGADDGLRQAGSAQALVPIGRGIFRPADLPHEWRFVAATAGRPARLMIRDSWPTWRVFERIEAPMPDAVMLARLAGRYRSDEAGTDFAVALRDGRLRLAWPRGHDIALDPVGGDRFASNRGTVSFVRDAAGAVTGLTISGRRLRRFPARRLGP